MAATIKIYRWTGATATPTYTDITSTTNRAATSDSASETTGNPIPVPSDSSTNYSYWVATRLYSVTGPATSITNIKWYSDGANSMGTGVALKAATASAYQRGIGTTGTSGSQLTSATYGTGWDFAGSAATSAFVYTSGAQLSVTGSTGTASSAFFGDFVLYQVEVISSAAPGPTTAETLTWQYDET